MARIRTIKPSFFLDDELCELPPLARILFAGLWCQADGHGRLEDRPKRLEVEILPYDDCDFDGLLDRLDAGGFIQRYEVDGRGYIAIPNFRKHQRISGEEASAESAFPEPPKVTKQRRSSDEAVEKQSRSSGEAPVALEGKGREGKGKEEDRAADAARAQEAIVGDWLKATDADATLKLQATPTTAPSKPKRAKATNPRVGEVIALWCRLWADWKDGDKYQISGKDAGQAKTLASWPAATDAEIERRFKRATLDPWFADKADLGLFVSQWNKHGGGSSDKLAAPALKPAFDVRTCPNPYPDFDPDWTPPALPKVVSHG